MTIITSLLAQFSQLDLITLIASLILFFASTPICRWLSHDDALSARIRTMRTLNSLIIIAVLADVFIFQHNSEWVSKITRSLVVVYFAVLITQIINFFVLQRFGKMRTREDKQHFSDTYSSRALSLVVAFVITLISFISCLRILGFDSLLETGSTLGIVGIALAMTQAAWAPDIIAGLIILNSRLCEEGDVIQFQMDGERITASVFRTKRFHTELLDIANNHRLMVRNNKLRDYGIQNLSRFASAKGLRERLLFNIAYEHSQEEVTAMIHRAFETIDKMEDSREEQFDPEIMVQETGDYAVTWAIYYYTKDVKRLTAIKQNFRSYILKESILSNISLATPDLVSNDVMMKKHIIHAE